MLTIFIVILLFSRVSQQTTMLLAGDAKPPKEVQTRLEVITAIASICNDKELKSAAKAALSLGYLAAGDRSGI